MDLTISSSHFIYPELLEELLESDAAYFRAAAECENVQGFRISHMPGLESLAAACVVHKISRHGGYDHPQWLQAVEQRVQALACRHARFYLQHPDDELENQLRDNGYRPVREIALLNTYENPDFLKQNNDGIKLKPVLTERDWSLKLSLHQEIPKGPDGHVSRAETWLQMERMKCAAGYMEPYLIFSGDTACGAVNYAPESRIGRLKNIVIHPRWQRRSIGAQAARLIANIAKDRGMAAAGCFALEDGQALNMYRKAGYTPATQQTEWYKLLK